MLLALDTASRSASIALYDGQRVLSESTWHSARQHTVELMPRVADMLDQADSAVEELTAVAVASGPGSFTGLRVALSVAKGLAFGRDLALLGVSTLDVTAFPHRWQPRPVCALVQAGRGRACWALYGWEGHVWRATSEYRISSVESLITSIAETRRETVIAGEINPGTVDALRAGLAAAARIALPAAALRRAGYLAELAWARHQSGERDEPASLAPIYLHEPAGAVGG